MDESKGNYRYNIILGHDILSELQIGICFSNNKMRGDEVTYEGCTAPMKYITNIMAFTQAHDENFLE